MSGVWRTSSSEGLSNNMQFNGEERPADRANEVRSSVRMGGSLEYRSKTRSNFCSDLDNDISTTVDLVGTINEHNLTGESTSGSCT